MEWRPFIIWVWGLPVLVLNHLVRSRYILIRQVCSQCRRHALNIHCLQLCKPASRPAHIKRSLRACGDELRLTWWIKTPAGTEAHQSTIFAS